MHIVRALKRVRLQDWAWVHFKFALGIAWPLLTLAALPPSVNTIQQGVVYAWFGLTIVGAILSIVGIIMSAQPGKAGVLGIPIELAGLVFLFAGPFLLFLVYMWLYFWPNGTEIRPTVIGLTWALWAGVLARSALILPRYRREAHDETKES